MARILTAAQVQIRPEQEATYVAVVQQLAGRLALRGQKVWLFRHRQTPGLFLEFTEGQDEGTHRSAGPADDEERALEARLRELGEYQDAAPIRWDEVRFGG